MLKGHTNEVHCVVLLEWGRLASASRFDKTIRIWDWTMDYCERVLEGDTMNYKEVHCMAPLEGGRLAAACDDWGIRIWDWTTGDCEKELWGHLNPVQCCCSGALMEWGNLASGAWGSASRWNDDDNDFTVRIWDTTA